MAYFAFDFDDVIRVNNVRHTGKIGFRVTRNSRGFLDRSVWESRNINTERGLKQLMQGAMKFSSVACVLIGTNTWFSRWGPIRDCAFCRERACCLMAVDLNSLNHHHRKEPDPLSVNPLSFMGVRKDEGGAWHLVERVPVELENRNVIRFQNGVGTKTISRLYLGQGSFPIAKRALSCRCQPTHGGTTSCLTKVQRTLEHARHGRDCQVGR